MTQRPTRWIKAQFVQSQTRRDIDLEHWWQLPDDLTRTKSAWFQLLVDLVAPTTFSEWHEKIAERRVYAYDRLRPYVTRTAFLCVLVAAVAVLGADWWIWIMLVPAVLQVFLETYLHKYIDEAAPEPRWRLARRMRDMMRKHFQTMLLNVTGILGALACPLNVVAACFTPAGGEQGWIKIAALGAAILYLNSGLASAFLDPPNYTENSVMPPVMHWVRPYAPLFSYGIVTAVVATSTALGRWEPAITPLAFLCAALTLLLGGTIRNHDRMISAAAYVGRKAVEAGRKELGGVVHDELGPAKAAAESVSELDGVSYRDVVDLQALSAFLTHFSTRVGIFASRRMDLRYLVEKIASPYGLSRRDVSYDIDWDTDTLRLEDHRIAIRMTTALVHNVGQALQKDEFQECPKSVVLEGFTSGVSRDLRYHLAVRDHLPVIPDADWCPDAGGTLTALRAWLRETFNGDLTQDDMGDGTKRIVASWSDRPPIKHYDEPTHSEVTA